MSNKKKNQKPKEITKEEIKEERHKAAARANRERAARKKNPHSRRDYWKGVKREMGKVIWPTRKELGSYTVVVIATCALFALGFWLIDTGWLTALKAALGVTLS